MGDQATTLSQGDVQSAIQEKLYPTPAASKTQPADDPPVTDEESTVQEDDASTLEDDVQSDESSTGEKTLADYLGIHDDDVIIQDDGEVIVNAKVDGETVKVKLTDLVKNYQLESHIQRKSQEFAQKKRTIEEQLQTAHQTIKQQLTQASAISEFMEKQLVSEYNSINWEQLKVDDPTQFVLKRQEFAEKAQTIEQAKELILAEHQQEAAKLQEYEQSQFQQYLQQQAALMLEKNPSWSTPSVRENAVQEIRQFLSSTYSFSDDDLKYVSDHRLVSLIQDAMSYHKSKQSLQEKVKDKVVPKFQKPGRSDQTAKARQVKAKRDALRKSGSQNDLAAVLLDRM